VWLLLTFVSTTVPRDPRKLPLASLERDTSALAQAFIGITNCFATTIWTSHSTPQAEPFFVLVLVVALALTLPEHNFPLRSDQHGGKERQDGGRILQRADSSRWVAQRTRYNEIWWEAKRSADRKKRKNEKLAAEIFGRNRRQSAPVAANTRNIRPAVGGSLASRVGVVKVCSVGGIQWKYCTHNMTSAHPLQQSRDRTAQRRAMAADQRGHHQQTTADHAKHPLRSLPTQ